MKCFGREIRLRRWAAVCAVMLLGAVAASFGVPYLLPPCGAGPFLATEPSPVVCGRDGETLYAFLNDAEQWCFPRPLERFSPHLVAATIAAEDQRFYRHTGVDWWAVARAAWQNLRARRVVSGASTLTMQLIKIEERLPASLPAKWRQAAGAVRLEKSAEKSGILAAYLNRAPYGRNLVGAEAAALRYFGKPAGALTVPEAALLAALPKSPTACDPFEHPERARARRDYVLRRMCAEGYISREAYARAAARGLGVAWHAFPQRAAHAALTLEDHARREGRVRLTLDAGIQALAEEKLARRVRRFGREITNGAVLIADVLRGEVLARVGSAGYFGEEAGRQLDHCTAPRSPGSALKPFTYALAIERQKLYPSERLLDDTLDYGAYAPENFDGVFNGLVTAREALTYSLNVPAVALLERIGPAALHGFLRQAGVTTLKHAPAHYGLGLTLGNAEMRLDELVAAYCSLARLGEYRPLRLLADTPASMPSRLLAPGTALALFRMLEQPFPAETRADLPRQQGVRRRVCWKTGTSTGYHDAWAFAFNARYVVGVWLGNSDGRPSKRLVGARAALPLAAALFQALPLEGGSVWPSPGDALREVEVCAASGLPAAPWCPATETVWLPANQYLHRRCDVHHPGPDGGVVTRWPASPNGWDLAKVRHAVRVRETGQAQAEEHAPQRRKELAIRNPAHRAEFVLTGAEDGDRIPVQASPPDAALHWYLDERYLGSTQGGEELLLDLTPGGHRLTCMALSGKTASVRYRVVRPGRRGS